MLKDAGLPSLPKIISVLELQFMARCLAVTRYIIWVVVRKNPLPDSVWVFGSNEFVFGGLNQTS
jgi:hypothetical protein